MDIKKWLFRTNEDGYINRENEKLENILMIIFFITMGIGIFKHRLLIFYFKPEII